MRPAAVEQHPGVKGLGHHPVPPATRGPECGHMKLDRKAGEYPDAIVNAGHEATRSSDLHSNTDRLRAARAVRDADCRKDLIANVSILWVHEGLHVRAKYCRTWCSGSQR